MLLPPRDSVLGPLEIVDVFDVYDFPRLFLAQSVFGNRYVVLNVTDEPDLGLGWLYLLVTPQRLDELRVSRLSLRAAFSKPEGVLLYVLNSKNQPSKIQVVEEVPTDWLPSAGEYLLSHEAAAAVVPQALPTASLARKLWRDVAAVAFNFAGFPGLTAPIRPLSELLSAFQQGIDTLAAAAQGVLAPRGPLSADVLSQTQFQFATVFESSFGVTISATTQSDLFGGSLAGSGLSALADLVRASGDYDSLVPLVRRLGPRATARYRALVEVLSAADATLEISWASPTTDEPSNAFLGREGVANALEYLTRFALEEAPVENFNVVLVGANTRTRTYEVLVTPEGRRITGRIADDALSQVRHATLNEQYKATLRPLVEIDSATGEERVKWLMVGLETRGA